MTTEEKNNMEVDLVYLWVNGNDPEWRKKRSKFSKENYSDAGRDTEARYQDNGELKYSLRSVELYAPWIHRIFIVTDNQIPAWLDTSNPKIRIVDHKEFIPEKALPTFNSNVIEHSLHKIPGLSETFLYANDDMFFNREVKPRDFFASDGLPIVRLNRRWFRKFWIKFVEKVLHKSVSNYNLAIQRSALLVERKYGKYIGHKTHHNIDSYRKSDFIHTYEMFREEIEATFSNHIRGTNDVQRNIYSFVPIIEKKAHPKFVSQKQSFRCHIEKPHYFKRLEKYNPLLFCVNDSQYADDNSHLMLREFLKKRFPEKSQFEKKEQDGQ